MKAARTPDQKADACETLAEVEGFIREAQQRGDEETRLGRYPAARGVAARQAMNKFGATPTVVDGIRFASLKEARRWGELRLMEKAGEVRNLRRQVVIPLQGRDGPLKTRTGRPMRLTVDFAYEDSRLNWATVYEDSKGKPTRDYEVRRAVAQAMGLEITET